MNEYNNPLFATMIVVLIHCYMRNRMHLPNIKISYVMITDPIELHTAVFWHFLYEIPEDGPCGSKHVVKYDTCHNKGHANIVADKGVCYYFSIHSILKSFGDGVQYLESLDFYTSIIWNSK
jgi:hypothetical protein